MCSEWCLISSRRQAIHTVSFSIALSLSGSCRILTSESHQLLLRTDSMAAQVTGAVGRASTVSLSSTNVTAGAGAARQLLVLISMHPYCYLASRRSLFR